MIHILELNGSIYLSRHSRRTRIRKPWWKSTLLRWMARRHHLRWRCHARIRSRRCRVPFDSIFVLFTSSFVTLTRRGLDNLANFCLVNLSVLSSAFNLKYFLSFTSTLKTSTSFSWYGRFFALKLVLLTFSFFIIFLYILGLTSKRYFTYCFFRVNPAEGVT